MPRQTLQRSAWTVLVLNVLYTIADALCGVFVGVYFYVNSLDFNVVCIHYLVLYLVTPVVFILAGWYSQRHDRLHVFQLGLLLHAVYYGLLLYLGEASARHPVELGFFLGITWGIFWAGNNVFGFDVTAPEERDYFFGWISAATGAARLFAPLLSGAILYWISAPRRGYQVIFALAVLVYLAAIAFSVRVPSDSTPRPFKLWRALFPGRDQRDWRWMMLAATMLSGTFHLLYVVLGVLMYLKTVNEASVGAYAALQAFASILTSYFAGRMVTPRTRPATMRIGVVLLLVAGLIILFQMNLATLILFGFLQAFALPLFVIPHSSLKFDVIERCLDAPHERIEYISAWEIPLAVGRGAAMLLVMGLAYWWGDLGLRIALFVLCANHLAAYAFVCQVSGFRDR
ncbi:MAG: MFS transporter [Candidatus Hydrogenedentes bacterium]|nr:MFS transporter [Candidatus Hydrogenedentota bacterium]